MIILALLSISMCSLQGTHSLICPLSEIHARLSPCGFLIFHWCLPAVLDCYAQPFQHSPLHSFFLPLDVGVSLFSVCALQWHHCQPNLQVDAQEGACTRCGARKCWLPLCVSPIT